MTRNRIRLNRLFEGVQAILFSQQKSTLLEVLCVSRVLRCYQPPRQTK